MRGEFPRGDGGRAFAAIHVERQANDEYANAAVAQHRGDRLNVLFERAPCDDPQRMRSHRGRVGDRNPDSPAAEINRCDWHPHPRPVPPRTAASRHICSPGDDSYVLIVTEIHECAALRQPKCKELTLRGCVGLPNRLVSLTMAARGRSLAGYPRALTGLVVALVATATALFLFFQANSQTFSSPL